jgi:hypothetical protein
MCTAVAGHGALHASHAALSLFRGSPDSPMGAVEQRLERGRATSRARYRYRMKQFLTRFFCFLRLYVLFAVYNLLLWMYVLHNCVYLLGLR